MASELLKTLKKIEYGRQGCVNSITSQGINIRPNASLEEIAGVIDSNFEGKYSYITDIRYYDNPFEDPDLPQIDPFVKDCENIFYNAEPITQDGKTYYPAAMFLLDVDESMTETIIQNRNYVNIGSSGIRLGYNGNWSVLTNDGSFYVMKGTDDYRITHAWDNTKDIIDPVTNKHYKYVIGYATGNSRSNIVNSAFDTSTNKIKVIAAYISMTRVDNGNNSSLMYNSMESVQYIHYYEKTKNDPGRTAPTAIITNSRATQIVIDDTNVDLSNTNPYFTTVIFICNLHNLLNYKLYPIVKYIKAPVFSLSRYSSESSIIPGLKYLEVTNMEIQETIREESSYQFPPLLKDPHILFATLNKIKTNTFNYGNVFKNITLPNVTSLENYAFQYFNCDTLELPNYEDHSNDKAFYLLFCRVLKLNNLKNISAAINNGNPGLGITLQRLEMHSAVNIPVNVIGSTYHAIKILDFPSCTSSAINFSNYKNLHTLILGTGYKGNLNFKYCNNLSKASLLDLFNKVATLGEEESYTISLPKNYCYMFTESEIEQVTNKGWTVNFES